MTLYENLHARAEVGGAFVSDLARALGGEVQLSVGEAGDSVNDIAGGAPARVVVVGATVGDGGEVLVALVALPDFAAKLERVAPDELLSTAAAPALLRTVDAVATLAGTEADAERPYEADLGAIESGPQDATVAYPILEGDTRLGALVIVLSTVSDDRPSAAPASATTTNANRVSDAQLVLADVEMGITAELGRSTLTIRDLLSIGPGTVIDLDRAATAPVDILVNGTVIARGEVVVIDEEFGVRILEIIGR